MLEAGRRAGRSSAAAETEGGGAWSRSAVCGGRGKASRDCARCEEPLWMVSRPGFGRLPDSNMAARQLLGGNGGAALVTEITQAADMAEERESLRRQIQQLQGLISRHKHVHGDAPAPVAPAHLRWRNPSQPQYRPQRTFRGAAATTGYQPRQPGQNKTWRAQYSLVNRTPAELTVPPPVVNPSSHAPRFPVGGHVHKATTDYNLPKSGTLSNPAMSGNLSFINHKTVVVPKTKCQPAMARDNPALPSTSADWGNRTRASAQESSSRTAPQGKLTWTSQDVRSPAHGSTKTPQEKLSWTSQDVRSPAHGSTKTPQGKLSWTSQDVRSPAHGSTKTAQGKLTWTSQDVRSPAHGSTKTPQEKLTWPSQDVRSPAHGSTKTPQGKLSWTSQDVMSSAHGSTKTAQGKLSWTSQDVRSSAHGSTKTAQGKLSWPSQDVRSPAQGASKTPQGKLSWTSQDVRSSAHGSTKTAQGKLTWTSEEVRSPAQGSTKTLPPSKKPSAALTKSVATVSDRGATKKRPISSSPSPNLPKSTLPAATPARPSKSVRTKYTWVASSKTNLPGKRPSPVGKSGNLERVKSPPAPNFPKGKKVSQQKASPKNRYKWKAEPSTSAPPTPGQAAVHRTVQRPGSQSLYSKVAPSVRTAESFRDATNSSYKIKSRTKLVRRRSTSRSPVEKKAPPLPSHTVKSRYSLRKSSPRVKSPVTVRRVSPRGLVHISKHRLRRVPPPSPGVREGTSRSPSVKSSASSRVINTRYRIVKRAVSTPLVSSQFSSFSPYLSWKNRVLLFNRSRQFTQVRRGHAQQRWRNRGLRCIGGAIYRVSDNKLSKAWSPGTASKPTAKTGKTDVSSISPVSLHSSRSSTPSRYIASRAVQRSLAIIRQAQHKKVKKEYCMYYNRFGRCNRGDACPFIHDPEKVAVCTRFVRGTCKADGTCPFSHKVSQDKMPVCSYFLRGICHKTDCPYSHVYVSRKAEICQDFLKGYCPMGAKCKKKHTLVCPHFAQKGTCPDGTKCKMQHHRRKRQTENKTDPEHTATSCKRHRRAEEDSGEASADQAQTVTFSRFWSHQFSAPHLQI
ncbi:zinc finger CCCH domain-containing protein 3 isoform X2 [Hyperolius riggenbachi]|uniref:zinc finger CCCH domain-containing protein 3 isoform X2 n=1 Tax=Hyperolius riggenbachi TaxID=752182 RepID=UPI0035A28E4F